MFRALSDAGNQHARGERVEGPAVADFHLRGLLAVAAFEALVGGFAREEGALRGEVRGEEGGGVEVRLDVSEHLGGGAVGGFVYC